MFEPRYFPDHFFKPEKAFGACIRFIAVHHSSPLLRAHGRRPAVRQQVDQHVFGPNEKRIKRGSPKDGFPLRLRRELDRLDGLYFEGFDDGLHKSHA
ncbi:MAG: hypothetical protein HW374_2028 [Bacteroidetes bacterium]|nr:hypothetical protein [Bacteroidota bacterium]